MKDQRCENCRFWCKWDDGVGWCKRYAPVMIAAQFPDDMFAGSPYQGVHPETEESDWCGEWQAKQDATSGFISHEEMRRIMNGDST